MRLRHFAIPWSSVIPRHQHRRGQPTSQPHPYALLLILLAASCGLASCADEGAGRDRHRWQPTGALPSAGDALAVLEERWLAAGDGQLYASSDGGHRWSTLTAAGLPPGRVITLKTLDASAGVLLAHLWGKGLYRSEDSGQSWQALEPLAAKNLATAFLNPRLQYLPLDIAVDEEDPRRVYLAAPGGLFRSEDLGASWSALPADLTGKLSLLFTAVAARGETVCALAQAPASMIPAQYLPFLGSGVLCSTDGGETWEDVSPGLSAKAFTGVLLDEASQLYVTAMDGGLYAQQDGGWVALGGPHDAVDCAWTAGGIVVASASRGVWRYDQSGGEWTSAGAEPVAALSGSAALGSGGTVWALEQGQGEPPPAPAGGTVHLALSFHTNLYHSYRGDTPDEKGYGTDLRVMRATLDWLDAYPEVRGEWDIENAFSLDDVLPREGADILQRIKAHVTAETGDVRIMSWNNGALAAQTRTEFDASVTRAQGSLQAAFGRVVPGVQPQECMFSPDHIGWYQDHDLEWITLFNSATPFTAIRHELALRGEALYNPLTLVEGEARLTLVPAYHHGDILDHGGLRAWVQQIADSVPGDTLLLIHMDADSEFWVNFDLELADIAELPNVRYTTIQQYLDTHPPVAEVSLSGDLADGAQDGFQSWAEKAFNHEIATGIAQAREDAARAAALGAGQAGVEALLEEALTARLLALSTTHFGLASPYLAEERMVTARARVEEARETARAALEVASAATPLASGELQVIDPLREEGTALLAFEVTVPAASYQGPAALAVLDGQGAELPAVVVALDEAADPVRLSVELVRALDDSSAERLTWRYDPVQPAEVRGSLTAADLATPEGLALPFTECNGARQEAIPEGAAEVTLDSRALRVQRLERFRLPLCDGEGTVTRTLSSYQGMEGTVVTVEAQLGQATLPKEAESVALTPLGCGGPAAKLSWLSFGGTIRSTVPRPLQESQNNWAADGWVELSCAGGGRVQVAHTVTQRSSLAFAPLRNDGADAILAPLGTLWGDGPYHDARRTGGLGHGGIVTWMVAPQFRPSAPDWSGAEVRYRLLVGDALAQGTLALFAHPPLVRVGR